MARLKHPVTGTVVEIEGDLEDQYRAAGWEEDKPKRASTRKKAAATDAEE